MLLSFIVAVVVYCCVLLLLLCVVDVAVAAVAVSVVTVFAVAAATMFDLGMEWEEITEAGHNVDDLISEYEQYQNATVDDDYFYDDDDLMCEGS